MDGQHTGSQRSVFSNRLRSLRLERGLKQAEVASRIGVAQTTIANYEQGTRFPEEETLRRLADLFEVSIDWLFGRASDPAAPRLREEAAPGGGATDREVAEVARYLEAVVAGNHDRARELIEGLESNGWGVREIYTGIFVPALHACGLRWAKGEVDVAQEHLVTEATEVLMAQLLARAPAATRKPFSVVAVSVFGELHNIGVRMVSDLLQLEGWSTYYLGANLPTESIVGAVAKIEPDLLAISATMQYSTDAAAAIIAALRRVPSKHRTKVMVGGEAFDADPMMWQRVGADGWAPSVEEAVAVAKRLAGDAEDDAGG